MKVKMKGGVLDRQQHFVDDGRKVRVESAARAMTFRELGPLDPADGPTWTRAVVDMYIEASFALSFFADFASSSSSQDSFGLSTIIQIQLRAEHSPRPFASSMLANSSHAQA